MTSIVLSILMVINLESGLSCPVYGTGVATPKGMIVCGASVLESSRCPLSGSLYAFSTAGEFLWKHHTITNDFVMGVDAKFDRIVVGYKSPEKNKGSVEAFDLRGNVVWKFPSGINTYCRVARLGDITEDPGLETFVAGSHGEMTLLDWNGRVIWQQVLWGGPNLQAARIADIDRDGRNEIIVTGGWVSLDGKLNTGQLRVVNPDGSIRWTAYPGVDVLGVAVDDFYPNIEGLEIFIPNAKRQVAWADQHKNQVSMYDSRGNLLWKQEWWVPIWTACSGDVNGDGAIEIIFGYGNHDVSTTPQPGEFGGIVVMSSQGIPLATYALPSSVKMIEWDKRTKTILAPCDDGRLYVLKVSK